MKIASKLASFVRSVLIVAAIALSSCGTTQPAPAASHHFASLPTLGGGTGVGGTTDQLSRIRATAAEFCDAGFSDVFDDMYGGFQSFFSGTSVGMTSAVAQAGGWWRMSALGALAAGDFYPYQDTGAGAASIPPQRIVGNPASNNWYVEARLNWSSGIDSHNMMGVALVTTNGATTGHMATNLANNRFILVGLAGTNSSNSLTTSGTPSDTDLEITTWDGSTLRYTDTGVTLASIGATTPVPFIIGMGQRSGTFKVKVDGNTVYTSSIPAGTQTTASWPGTIIFNTSTTTCIQDTDYYYGAGDRF